MWIYWLNYLTATLLACGCAVWSYIVCLICWNILCNGLDMHDFDDGHRNERHSSSNKCMYLVTENAAWNCLQIVVADMRNKSAKNWVILPLPAEALFISRLWCNYNVKSFSTGLEMALIQNHSCACLKQFPPFYIASIWPPYEHICCLAKSCDCHSRAVEPLGHTLWGLYRTV